MAIFYDDEELASSRHAETSDLNFKFNINEDNLNDWSLNEKFNL